MTITSVTDDVAAMVAAALAAGARPCVEPIDKPWGQTVAYIIDPGGTIIEIATPVGGG